MIPYCRIKFTALKKKSAGKVSVNAGTMVVESVVLTVADPPPERLAVFTREAGALDATFIVTVMGGYATPPGSASLRVHVLVLQAHPVPNIDISARPEGTGSVTVTVPFVGTTLAGLDTLIV